MGWGRGYKIKGGFELTFITIPNILEKVYIIDKYIHDEQQSSIKCDTPGQNIWPAVSGGCL